MTEKFVSTLGYDYTEFVTTQEKREAFDKLCELELKTKRPLKECVHEVAEVLRLDGFLRTGKTRKVFVQGNVSDN